MRNATSEEFDLFSEMVGTIRQNERRNALRTTYVEMEHITPIPRRSVWLKDEIEHTPLGWPGKAARVFGSRLTPLPHRAPNSAGFEDDLREAREASALEAIEAQAIKAAVRHGCSFVFSSKGGPGEPDVVSSVRSARQATAIMDPRSRMTVAALEDIGGGRWNLYRPGWVGILGRRPSGILVVEEEFAAPQRVLCTPFVHDPDPEKPFGASRITREQMAITNAGIRTLYRSEVSADYYSAPRPIFKGISLDDLLNDDGVSPALRKAIGDIWGIPDISIEDDPDIPDELRRVEVQMLPQHSMQPFSDQMRMILGQFSQASSLPLHYLGLTHDANPQSAEAIAAQETDLIRAVRDQIPFLAMARRQYAVDVLTAIHGDLGSEAARAGLRGLQAGFSDPKEISASEASQMVQLQTTAGNLRPGGRVALDLLPLTPEQRETAERENRVARGSATLESLRAAEG